MKLRMMASLDSGLIVVVAILGFCGAILVRKIPNSFCIAILVMKTPNSFFFAIFVRKTKKTVLLVGKPLLVSVLPANLLTFIAKYLAFLGYVPPLCQVRMVPCSFQEQYSEFNVDIW